jgi:hypothetical protein
MHLAILALVLSTNISVNFVPDEARAVLAILDMRAAKQPVPDAAWQALFASEGYVRLKKRELSMHRPFDEETFRKFVMSDELLGKREMLARTLDNWLASDLNRAAGLALAYLPPDSTIRATVYPVIKPAKNSFVFERNAIFMYVEDIPREEFEATIAHEMHHIGYGTACKDDGKPLPENLARVEKWLSAFGEGFATLAAAGGPGGPPQRKADVRAEWEKELSRLDAKFAEVATFFESVLDGKLAGDAADKRAFEFFGMVGPWYTVGYRMAVVIEKMLGHDALIAAMCDTRHLLATYNRAVRQSGERLPLWPERLTKAFD